MFFDRQHLLSLEMRFYLNTLCKPTKQSQHDLHFIIMKDTRLQITRFPVASIITVRSVKKSFRIDVQKSFKVFCSVSRRFPFPSKHEIIDWKTRICPFCQKRDVCAMNEGFIDGLLRQPLWLHLIKFLNSFQRSLVHDSNLQQIELVSPVH